MGVHDATRQRFEARIGEQEDLLYGVALFFEGISLLFAGQDDVLETYRKQFRNIIQRGNDDIERARQLLADTRRDDRKLPVLEQFTFEFETGHPDTDKLVARARTLMATYAELFPNRARDETLNEDETLRLMNAASERDGSMTA